MFPLVHNMNEKRLQEIPQEESDTESVTSNVMEPVYITLSGIGEPIIAARVVYTPLGSENEPSEIKEDHTAT